LLHRQGEYDALLSTILVFIFAFACLSTFLCGMREQWKTARLVSMATAIIAFLLALLVSIKPA